MFVSNSNGSFLEKGQVTRMLSSLRVSGARHTSDRAIAASISWLINSGLITNFSISDKMVHNRLSCFKVNHCERLKQFELDFRYPTIMLCIFVE